MRPEYETKEDRDNQVEVLFVAAQKWSCSFESTPSKCPYDAVFVDKHDRSSAKAFGEVKQRTTEMGRYTEYMLSFEKWRELLSSALWSKLPVLLIVRFKDKTMWCDLMDVFNTEGAWRVGMGQRNKRGDGVDKADIEPMVYIKNDQFKELRGGD